MIISQPTIYPQNTFKRHNDLTFWVTVTWFHNTHIINCLNVPEFIFKDFFKDRSPKVLERFCNIICSITMHDHKIEYNAANCRSILCGDKILLICDVESLQRNFTFLMFLNKEQCLHTCIYKISQFLPNITLLITLKTNESNINLFTSTLLVTLFLHKRKLEQNLEA